jgi:primosomal protein N''
VITNQVPYLSETLLSLGNFAIMERLVKLYAVRKEAFTPEVMAEWKTSSGALAFAAA